MRCSIHVVDVESASRAFQAGASFEATQSGYYSPYGERRKGNMSILVACGECQRNFKVKDRYAGMTGACPFCGNMLIVPKADPGPSDEPEFVHSGSDSTEHSTSSLSLMTRVPMKPCGSCGKDILVGSPSCFYCGAQFPEGSGAEPQPAVPSGVTGDRAMLAHIQQVLAQEQARLRVKPGERPGTEPS
jgi:hypothetical protein